MDNAGGLKWRKLSRPNHCPDVKGKLVFERWGEVEGRLTMRKVSGADCTIQKRAKATICSERMSLWKVVTDSGVCFMSVITDMPFPACKGPDTLIDLSALVLYLMYAYFWESWSRVIMLNEVLTGFKGTGAK